MPAAPPWPAAREGLPRLLGCLAAMLAATTSSSTSPSSTAMELGRAAAAQLGIAPPALTQAIRALEEHLSVRLLNRTTRSVSLTTAGEQLLHHMQPVMAAIDDALDAMNSFRDNPRGHLPLREHAMRND